MDKNRVGGSSSACRVANRQERPERPSSDPEAPPMPRSGALASPPGLARRPAASACGTARFRASSLPESPDTEHAQNREAIRQLRGLLTSSEPAPTAGSAVDILFKALGRLTATVERIGEGPEADPTREAAMRRIESLLEKAGKASDRLAEAARERRPAAEEEVGPLHWMQSSEFADAVDVFAKMFGALAERYPAMPPTEPSAVRGTGKPRKTAAPATPASAPQCPQALSLALERAEHLLRSGRRLTVETVQEMGADPLRLARKIGKDVGNVELMIRHGHDPMSIATTLRAGVQGWFGDVDKLRKARAQIGSLQGADLAQAQALIARLDERIAALGPVQARILADEVAALKALERPRETHVNRLLELGEILTVAGPRKLRSDDDKGELGRLFELVIQPAPLPDGAMPDAIFLHAHTRELVTKEQCLSLDYQALAAVHVKNARQKDLGARWEQEQKVQPADRIHRGPVHEALWKRLRDLAAAQRPA